MTKITVLLCDDHSIVRQGIRFLLEAAGDIQVVAQADNGHTAVEVAKRCQPSEPAHRGALTSRQTELVQLIAEGYSSKQIAAMLNLGTKTVGHLRDTIMDKLGLQGIASLTRYAVSNGIVDLNRAGDWLLKYTKGGLAPGAVESAKLVSSPLTIPI